MNGVFFIPIIVGSGGYIDSPSLIWFLVVLSLFSLFLFCFRVYIEIQLAKSDCGLEGLLKKEQDLKKQIIVIDKEIDKLKELENNRNE